MDGVENLMEESHSRWAFLILLSLEVELAYFPGPLPPAWTASSQQISVQTLTQPVLVTAGKVLSLWVSLSVEWGGSSLHEGVMPFSEQVQSLLTT